MGAGYTSNMARVRKPYWLPYSVPNWTACNLVLAAVVEHTLANGGVAWAAGRPMTVLAAGALLAMTLLHRLGRAAFVGPGGGVGWRQARLPEPGEPPPGNRLAWPGPVDAAARVATSAARALTQKRRHAPSDRGAGPLALVVVPLVGCMAAILFSVGLGVADEIGGHPSWANGAIWKIWLLWGAVVWACISASIVLKTRRLNEDA